MILKVKTKGGGVRLMLGRQARLGEGQGFSKLVGGPSPFYLSLVLHVGSRPTVGLSLNIMIELATSSDVKRP